MAACVIAALARVIVNRVIIFADLNDSPVAQSVEQGTVKRKLILVN